MGSSPTRQKIRVDRLVRKCPTFKVGYATRALALDGCERAMDAGSVSPGCHIKPYLCDECSEWHLFNQRIVFVSPEDLSRRDYLRQKD